MSAEPLYLKEQGPQVDLPSGMWMDRLVGHPALDVTPRWGGGATMKARNIVGVLRLGETQVHIEPKVGVGRLLFLLGYARNPDGWLDDPVELDENVELLPAMAHAFARFAERCLAAGLLQSYRTEEATLPALRGRLNEAAQVRAGRGLALPIAVRFDDYTADIAENRILRAALSRLLRMGGLPHRTTVSLRRIDAHLDGVRPLDPGETASITWNRRNARYRAAVTLGQIVLAGGSLESRVGPVAGSAFAFDMDRVFEDFLSVGLDRALLSSGGSTSRQATALTLDHERLIHLRPDLVWRSPTGPVIIDAKYKAGSLANGDAYQLVAYCTAYGAAAGHIVDVASGPLHGGTFSIRGSPIRIHRWHLDLGLSPAELLGQLALLAAGIDRARHTDEAV